MVRALILGPLACFGIAVSVFLSLISSDGRGSVFLVGSSGSPAEYFHRTHLVPSGSPAEYFHPAHLGQDQEMFLLLLSTLVLIVLTKWGFERRAKFRILANYGYNVRQQSLIFY